MSVVGGRCCLETRFPLSLKPGRNFATGGGVHVPLDGCELSSSLLFLFLRRHTHELKLHQLLVRVCGWEQVKPVSVDKVGVFFRYAAADRNNSSNTVSQEQRPKQPSLLYNHCCSVHLLLPFSFFFSFLQVGSPISRTNIIHPHVYVSLPSFPQRSSSHRNRI